MRYVGENLINISIVILVLIGFSTVVIWENIRTKGQYVEKIVDPLRGLPAYVPLFQIFSFIVTLLGSAALIGFVIGGTPIKRIVGGIVFLLGVGLLKLSRMLQDVETKKLSDRDRS